MSRVIDVRSAGGDLVVLGRALVLPASKEDGTDLPLDGSIRFNPDTTQIELCLSGVWSELSSTGSGGGSPSAPSGPIQISGVANLQSVLDSKASVFHVHTMQEITGLIPALEQKAPKVHVHSIDDIANLQPTLSGLTSGLATKANLVHTHEMTSIVGLQSALDTKANFTHGHPMASIVGLNSALKKYAVERASICFPGKPVADFTYAWVATQTVTFPDELLGSYGYVVTPPTADYVISITQNGVAVGTVTVKPSRQVIFSTLATTLYLERGEALVFHCPSSPDTTLDTLAMTLVADAIF